MPGTDEQVLELHAAAAKNARGHWLTQRVLDSLFTAVCATGCKTLAAQVAHPLHHRIWSRLGFTITNGIATMEVTDWRKNG